MSSDGWLLQCSYGMSCLKALNSHFTKFYPTKKQQNMVNYASLMNQVKTIYTLNHFLPLWNFLL